MEIFIFKQFPMDFLRAFVSGNLWAKFSEGVPGRISGKTLWEIYLKKQIGCFLRDSRKPERFLKEPRENFLESSKNAKEYSQKFLNNFTRDILKPVMQHFHKESLDKFLKKSVKERSNIGVAILKAIRRTISKRSSLFLIFVWRICEGIPGATFKESLKKFSRKP